MKTPVRHAFDFAASLSKPTVVVADDHQRMLDAVSHLLTYDFRVVAAVPDGRQAIDAVVRLDPDLALLDITMPELDGFRTAQALKHAGARAKVVFLTLHDADEYVEAALRSGAMGYVLKARMKADLASALHHALEGRSFLPSLTSLSTMAGDAGAHMLHLRASDGSVHDEVIEMLLTAVARDDMTVVLGTAELRTSIAGKLNAAGCDVAALRARGRYVEFDAADALSQVMRNGRLDRREVGKMVQDLERLRLSLTPVGRGRVTILGEMAGLLMRNGNYQAAVELEQTWSELTKALPYFTICSYPVQLLHSREPVWAAVCAEHSAICHSARLQ